MRMVPGKQPGELRLGDERINPDAHGVSIAFDASTGASSIETPIPTAARMAPERDVVIKMAKLKAGGEGAPSIHPHRTRKRTTRVALIS